MTNTTEIEPLSVWWADIKLEISVDGEFYISEESFERPVLIVDNKAYLVFKITSRLNREGYRIKDISVAGLPKESVIRTDILVPISTSDLRYKMGVLSRADRVGLRSYLNGHDSPRIMGRKRSSNRMQTVLLTAMPTVPEPSLYAIPKDDESMPFLRYLKRRFHRYRFKELPPETREALLQVREFEASRADRIGKTPCDSKK